MTRCPLHREVSWSCVIYIGRCHDQASSTQGVSWLGVLCIGMCHDQVSSTQREGCVMIRCPLHRGVSWSDVLYTGGAWSGVLYTGGVWYDVLYISGVLLFLIIYNFVYLLLCWIIIQLFWFKFVFFFLTGGLSWSGVLYIGRCHDQVSSI